MVDKSHRLLITFIAIAFAVCIGLWMPRLASAGSITVTTVTDSLDGSSLTDKECSLREAIENANNDNNAQIDCAGGSGHDTITIKDSGTFTLILTGTPGGEPTNSYGDLDITDDLTISGRGYKSTIIQAGTKDPTAGSCTDCIDRVFDIQSARVEMNDLTIRYGKAHDGDISPAGTWGEYGGGIRNTGGDLRLRNCHVRTNKAGNGDPGSDDWGGSGGGISSNGSLELIKTVISGNKAGDGSTGIGYPGIDGGNGGNGGGIHLYSYEVMTATNSTIHNNTAGDGGMVDNVDDMPAGNGGNGGYGGGINSKGIVTLINSTISSNASGDGAAGGNVIGGGTWDGGDGGNGGDGGGIYVHSSSTALTIIDSTLSGNLGGAPGLGGSGFGGGSGGSDGYGGHGGGVFLYGSNIILENTTLTGNHAFYGGGVYNYADVIFKNCTFSSNLADESGGGISSSGSANTEIIFSTITSNIADYDSSGSGDGGGIQKSTGTMTLTNTIVFENVDNGGQYNEYVGTINSAGYNLIGLCSGISCNFASVTSDMVGSSYTPGLDVLADNGGPTETHALLVTSDALSWIPYGTNGCGTIFNQDQRGEPRYGSCDIGAYERSFILFLPLILR